MRPPLFFRLVHFVKWGSRAFVILIPGFALNYTFIYAVGTFAIRSVAGMSTVFVGDMLALGMNTLWSYRFRKWVAGT